MATTGFDLRPAQKFDLQPADFDLQPVNEESPSGGVGTQLGIGARQGFAQLGEAGNALLQAFTRPLIRFGPISITGRGIESTRVAEAMEEQFKGASEVAGRRAAELESEGEKAGGPRFARRLAAGAVSVAPALAAAPVGIPAAIVAGGLQSFGSEFAAQQRALEAKGFTPQEAAVRSYAPALASGLITTATAALGGVIAPGIEGWTRAVRSPEFRKSAIEFLRNAGAEAGEEALDQIGQSVVQKLTRRPELTTQEALSETLEAGLIGGILGGGLTGVGMVSQQAVADKAQAAGLTQTAQTVSEITPRALDLTQENVVRQGEPITATLTPPVEEPLGVNRPEVIDRSLSKLSEDEFDSLYRQLVKDVDRLEAKYDEGTLTETERKQLGIAQDKYSSAELELFRRDIQDTHPQELFDKLRREPNDQRALLLLEELQRQGVTEQQLLSDISLRSPDEAEVFRGQMERIRNIRSKQTGEEITEPSVETVPPNRALEQRQTPPPIAPPPIGSATPVSSESPSIETFDKNKDFNILNNVNSPQFTFEFGKLGERAKATWEKMALGEMEMRENIAKDIALNVDDIVASLPRKMRAEGGRPLFEALDGKTEQQIVEEWSDKSDGAEVIAAASRVKQRLEEIRVDIRDTKKESYRNSLAAMNRETLVNLYKEDISSDQDVSQMTTADLANLLSEIAYPQDWGISDGSYLPHIFFGNWKVEVTKPGADKPSFVTRAKTPHEARAQIQEYITANPDLKGAKFTVAPDLVMPADIVRISDPKFFRLVNDMRNKFEVSTTDVRQLMQGILGRKAGKQKWFGNLQQRLGAKNYSKDFRDVMNAYLYGYHRWKVLSKLQRETAPEIEKIRTQEGRPNAANALDTIMENLWGKPAKTTMEFDALIRRVPFLKDHVKPLALNRWTQSLRSLTAGLHLMTLRFGILNRLQPLLGLYPMVGEKIMVQAKMLQHSQAGRELLQKYNVDYDVGQYGEPALKTKIGSIRERLSGEKPNQKIAFLAMYLHGRNQGLDEESAARYAKLRGQLMTQFTPLVSDTPPAFQGPIAATVFQYKRFPVKQLELAVQLLKEGNLPALSRMFLMYSVLGGLGFWARQALFPGDDDKLKWKETLDKELGKDWAEAIWYGLPGQLNADLSGSLSVMEPPIGSTLYEKIGRAAVGPGVSTAMRVKEIVTKESREPQDAMDRAINALRAIPSLRPIAELADLGRDNVDLRSPDGEIRYRRAIKDVLANMGSFRTATESNAELGARGSIEVDKERDLLLNRFYVAQQGTDEKRIEAQAEIDSFNNRWPEFRITPKDLRTYVSGRETKSKQTEIERAVPKRARETLLPEEQQPRKNRQP